MILDIENTDFCSYNSTLPTTDMAIADTFEEAVNMLGPDHSFAFFDLGLTAAEKEAIDQLKVTNEIHYGGSHPISFYDSYNDHLKDIGNAEELSSTISSGLDRIVNTIHQTMPGHSMTYGDSVSFKDANSYLHDIDSQFLLWHLDHEDSAYDNIRYRASIALKGSGTLFCKLSQDEQYRIEARNFASNIFLDMPQRDFDTCNTENGHSIHQAPSYFGAVFIIGKTNLAAIHTAPIIEDERMHLIFDPSTGY